jgi:hypothetical protein
VAAHLRQQIFDAAFTALTGLATTTTHIYRDRDTDDNPLQANELPGVVLVDDGDPAEIVSRGVSRILQRTMLLQVAAHVKAESSPGSTLNQILKEVEIALANANLAAAKYSQIVQVGPRETSEVQETKTVRQVFTFEVLYYTAHNAPDVAF